MLSTTTQPQAKPRTSPKIFDSQKEIASLVFDEIERKGIILQHKTLVPYFIGPSFTALKKQTETDLSSFLSQEEDIRFPAGYKDFVCNSSSLDVDQNIFLDTFAAKKDSSNHVFALFHDEYHWGVGFDSNINKFFQRLCSLSGDMFRQNLIIILVSATGELLTKLSHLQLPSVDWRQLRLNGVLKHPPIHYVGVESLQYMTTNYQNLKKDGIVESVVKYYSEEFDYNAFFQSFPNKLIIVRLNGEPSACTIYTSIKNKYPQRNFELILLTTKNKTVHEQLSREVIQHIVNTGRVSKVEDIQVKHLENIPCVLLVVDRLRVGERIPHTTYLYDVRAKYPTKINTRSTFIQDVGRCAGHYPPGELQPLVLVSKKAQDCFVNNKFAQLDTKLKRTDNMLNQHPEKNTYEDDFIPVYTMLQNQIVILSAEPQIGKTGVMLHLLTLLQSPSRTVSLRLFESLNNQYILIAADQLKIYYQHNPSQFYDYHRKRIQRNSRYWKEADPNEIIANEISTLITTNSAYRNIADCGCGFGSLFLSLKSKLQEDVMEDEEVDNLVIHGFDLCEGNIEYAPFTTTDLKVNFVYQCCDFKEIKGKFDIMVFCLSMMKEDITAYIQNAHSCLNDKNGLMYIAVTEHSKFPADLTSYGFRTLKTMTVTTVPNGNHSETSIHIHIFKKIKLSPLIQPRLLIDVSMHFC